MESENDKPTKTLSDLSVQNCYFTHHLEKCFYHLAMVSLVNVNKNACIMSFTL